MFTGFSVGRISGVVTYFKGQSFKTLQQQFFCFGERLTFFFTRICNFFLPFFLSTSNVQVKPQQLGSAALSFQL